MARTNCVRDIDLDYLQQSFEEVTRYSQTMSLKKQEIVDKLNRRLRRRWERCLERQAVQGRQIQQMMQRLDQLQQSLNEAFHEANPRPQRQRRAPNQLNIVSNSGESYQN